MNTETVAVVEPKINVRQIFEESNGFSRVSVNNELFKAIAGFVPQFKYETHRTANGKGVRAYNISGVTIFTQYDKDTNKTSIIMATEDANKYLKTLEDERAEGGEALAFAF